ncbi:c-type cytochrome [Alkalinema pantanalense CENA528]|uniref:c-type cytochrome n=1 Tax=Alkalinema pantanalense TaxID=1620705 RepID=UPI003D6EE5EA
MNEQLVKTEGFNRKAALGLLALLLVCGCALMGMVPFKRPDPYIRSVLTRPGNIVQGHAIFQMNCSGCHGLMADGKVGPSLKGVSSHKSRQALIEQVISGNTPPMPQFQPSPQEMADLLSYLESL